jgi:tetratricopeptide (TPR) repeat protein
MASFDRSFHGSSCFDRAAPRQDRFHQPKPSKTPNENFPMPIMRAPPSRDVHASRSRKPSRTTSDAVLSSRRTSLCSVWREAASRRACTVAFSPASSAAQPLRPLCQDLHEQCASSQPARPECPGAAGTLAGSFDGKRLASELDPLSQGIAVSEPWLALLQNRHQAAVEGFRKLAAASPGDVMVLFGLGIALAAKGDYQAALETFGQLQRVAPSSVTLAWTGYVQARNGNPAEARKILQELLGESRRQFVSPVCFAILYIGLGDADGAFRYLETAREQQESFLIFARVQSIYDPIRRDPALFDSTYRDRALRRANPKESIL